MSGNPMSGDPMHGDPVHGGTALALSVAGLTVTGPAGRIVEDVSLDVARGETVGIVGESGSGKSVTARALAGLLPPGLTAAGTLAIGGTPVSFGQRDRAWRAIRGAKITLLPQDPFTSLSPRHHCGDQIALPLRGQSRAQRAAAVRAALAEVGLPERVARQYPFELSGGMRQRVAVAAALITRPDVLIADEATTALDVTTQREVLDLLASLQRSRDMGLVLITHDLSVARGRADRITVLYAGRIAEQGTAPVVIGSPAHPYTARLLECDPPLHQTLDRLPVIPGSVPRLAQVGAACTFAARCAIATGECTSGVPPLAQVAPGHRAACVRVTAFQATRTGGQAQPRPRSASSADVATADSRTALLSVRDLRKSFGRHVALDGVGLDVYPGESVAVVGESGSGKTTLARIVVGLERADAGSVTVAQSATAPPQIVFQDPYSALNPSLTVGTSLRDALRAGGRPRTAAAVTELLEMVGLPAAYASRRPQALSGGERQRVAIARALAVRPDLLVCDEAVSSLDVSVQAQVLNLIGDLRASLGLSVLFISHDLAVVRQAAQRVYVLYRGRFVEQGETADVLDRPSDDYTRLLMASVPVSRS
jgi:peptide/nickel transport system ATP-binding protein